jgi:TRAP-type C4-dicarboxylate transport system substrate-binding protein
LKGETMMRRLSIILLTTASLALAFWDNGMKVFAIRGDEPLRTPPADFAGKKFRLPDLETLLCGFSSVDWILC